MAEGTKPGVANQGSYDTFLSGLTGNPAPQTPAPKPSAAREGAPPATVGANIGLAGFLKGLLPGNAAGNSNPNPIIAAAPQGAGDIGPAPNAPAGQPMFGLPSFHDLVSPWVAQQPVTPVPMASPDEAGGTPNIGAAVGATVAPQPQAPAYHPVPVAGQQGHGIATPGGVVHPSTHSYEDALKATEGMTWRQAAHLMAFAPVQMTQQQAKVNQLTGHMVDAHMAVYQNPKMPADQRLKALESALAYAKGAQAPSTLNNYLGVGMAPGAGMVAPIE